MLLLPEPDASVEGATLARHARDARAERLIRIQSTLDISNSDNSNSVKLEASI